MSFPSVLLRLLLAALLTFNGAGAAIASARMPMMHGAPAHSEPSAPTFAVSQSAQPPCHHPMASPMVHGGSTPSASKASAGTKTPPPDCCKSGNCVGACLYSVTGIAADAFVHDVRYRHAATVSTDRVEHVEPSLGLLIRPPIG